MEEINLVLMYDVIDVTTKKKRFNIHPKVDLLCCKILALDL